MKRSIIILVAFTTLIMFIAFACGPDAPPEEKEDTQIEETHETPIEGDEIERDSFTTEDGETIYDENNDEEYLDPEDVADDSDEVISTIINEEDGTVTVIDSTGNVQATSVSPAGTTSVQETGTQEMEHPVGISTGPVKKADDSEEPQKKEIKSRGDVTIKDKVAIIKTNFGDMYVFFFDSVAPKHVRNFIYLSEKDFYRDVKFHRIIPGFMAQAGMARNDWTETVPTMELEIDKDLNVKHRRGSVAAARTNIPNSATSQFYLVFERGASAQNLDGSYTVFGQIFKGFDVLDKLAEVRLGVASGGGGQPERSVPLDDVFITSVVIEDAQNYQTEIDKWKKDNNL